MAGININITLISEYTHFLTLSLLSPSVLYSIEYRVLVFLQNTYSILPVLLIHPKRTISHRQMVPVETPSVVALSALRLWQ